EDAAATPLVLADQRGPAPLAVLHVPVHAVPGQVRNTAREPGEVPAPRVRFVRLPPEDGVPAAPPGQIAGGCVPASVGVRQRVTPERRHARIDELYRSQGSALQSVCQQMLPESSRPEAERLLA